MSRQLSTCFAAAVLTAGVAGQATSAITVLHEWNLGDNDAGAVAGNPFGATSADNVGSVDLTTVGGPAYVNTPVAGLGAALSNAGSNDTTPATDYFEASGPITVSDGNNWGVELWINLNENPTANFQTTLFSFNDGANTYYAQNANGGWAFHVPAIALFPVSGNTADATGQWSHIVMLFEDGGAETYQDGVLVTSASSVGFTSTNINTFRVGANTAGNAGLDGQIGAVRVFEFGEGQFDINDTLVPEPSSLGLALLGAGMIFRRRRG